MLVVGVCAKAPSDQLLSRMTKNGSWCGDGNACNWRVEICRCANVVQLFLVVALYRVAVGVDVRRCLLNHQPTRPNRDARAPAASICSLG